MRMNPTKHLYSRISLHTNCPKSRKREREREKKKTNLYRKKRSGGVRVKASDNGIMANSIEFPYNICRICIQFEQILST